MMGNFNPCAVRSRDAGFDLPCISTCEYCEEEIDPYVSTPKEVQAVVDAAREFAEAWRAFDVGVQVYAEALCEALGVEP